MTRSRDLADSADKDITGTLTVDAAIVQGDIAVTGTVDGIDIATRDAILTSTTTTAGAALPKAGGALTGAVTTNSTFDGVDIATRDAVLTSTTTTAGAALPKAGGALTGAVTTNSTFDGRDVSADGVTADAALPKAGGAMTGAITTNSTFDGVDIATRDAVLTSTTTTANAALPKAGGTMTGNLTAPNLVASGSLSLNDGTDNFNIGVTTNRLTIKSTTSDGSDDTSILIDAGSAGESSSRGSYIEVHGNETSQDAGKVIYQMGNVSGSTHDFRKAGGTTAALITSSGYVGIGATNPDSPVTIQPAAQGIGTNSVQSWMYALSSGSEFDLKLNQVVSSGLVKYAFTLRNNGTSYANNLVLDRGNVGIGTTALESWKLNVAGTNFSSGGGLAVAAFRDLRSYNTSDNGGGIAFQGIYNSGGGYTNFATIQAGKLNNTDGDYSTYLRFLTRNNGASQAERMRIDNSGNVLVANTTGASSNTGHIFAPTGIAFHVRNGGVPLVVDRLTNDGDLQLFRKGGVTVGRIASRSSVTSTIILDPRTNGAGLSGTTNAILPTNNAGVLTNAATSLGITGGAFKDLHLSGGVVFGPASASNVSSQTLDSYEEGNASSLGLPSDGTGFTSSGATFAGAKYVKIGALVNVRFSVTFAGTSGNWTAGDGFYITGMPFTNNSIRSSGSCWASASWTAGNRVSGIAMAYNNSTAYVGIEYGSGVSRSTILYCSVTFNNT